MQTSFDPRQWNESLVDERERGRIGPSSTPEEVRRLFPLAVRILKDDRTYGLSRGQILLYARTKLKPSLYPIEAISYGVKHRLPRHTNMMQYNSDEVEVITPEEAHAILAAGTETTAH